MTGRIIEHMPRAQYDAIDAANFSRLRAMDRSPAHYKAGIEEEREDTDALLLGRAVDVAVFEPDRFADSFVVWEGGTRRGKEWDAFRERHASIDILTEAQLAEVRALSTAVRNDPHAAKWLAKGKAQATELWTQTLVKDCAIDLKARPDFISDAGCIVDLKTTRDASPEGFAKAAWNYRYFVQAAMYCDGFYAATGERLPFRFVVVEKCAPCVVQVYRVPDELMAAGSVEYGKWLGQLALCRLTEKWPAYGDGEMDLSLPRFAMQQLTEQMEGVQP